MRTLLLPLLAVSLVAASPMVASTTEDDPVSKPCLAQTGLDFILTTDGLVDVIPTPTLPSPYPLGLGGEPDPAGFQAAATDVYTVLLDVSPDYLFADAVVSLSWEHAGDIDMDLYRDGELVEGSHQFNPLAGNAESARIDLVGHCQTFDIHVRNYISGHGDIALDIDVENAIAPEPAA